MNAVAEAEVLIRLEGRTGHITLNRPKALNALTDAMVLAMEAALDEWAEDDRVALVLIDAAGERAFCAGGDIGRLYHAGRAGDFAYGQRFFADEYRLNAKVARFPKPYAAIMDGIVMGGGVGVSAHGSHRIVTERSMIAMPECGIGLVPDVGASLLLARAPGRLGDYLGLTGTRMKAGDAIYAGFADSFVPSDRLEALAARLVETADPAAIEAFAQEAPEAAIAADQERIDAAFGGATAIDIVHRLEADASDWARETLKAIGRGSPISLVSTLGIVRAARADPTIETALDHEYRFTYRAQEHGDFLEGTRAAVIDKDRQPRWSPARLEELAPEKVAAMNAPLGAHEPANEEKRT